MPISVEDVSGVPSVVALEIYGIVYLGIPSLVALCIPGKVPLYVSDDFSLHIPGVVASVFPDIVFLRSDIFVTR